MRKFKFTFVLLAFFTLFTAYANDVIEVPADEFYDYISSLKEPGTYKIKITGLEQLDEFPKPKTYYGLDSDYFSKKFEKGNWDDGFYFGIYIDLSATEIPDGMDMKEAFFRWHTLVASPKFLGSVMDNSLEGTFFQCFSLKKVTNLPYGVANMGSTFALCKSLTVAPEIPSSVKNMKYTFAGCISLTAAPEIPNSVQYMNCTFKDCTSLKIVEFFPDTGVYGESGTSPENIQKHYINAFEGVPASCKIYVDYESFWNNLTSYGCEVVKEKLQLADINMFVVKW